MLREIRHRRQRGLVGFLSCAILMVLASQGLVSAAPLAALTQAAANGQVAICTGSAIITVGADGETRRISVDICSDCLRVDAGAAPEAQTGPVFPPLIATATRWGPKLERASRSEPYRAHPARAPPLA